MRGDMPLTRNNAGLNRFAQRQHRARISGAASASASIMASVERGNQAAIMA